MENYVFPTLSRPYEIAVLVAGFLIPLIAVVDGRVVDDLPLGFLYRLPTLCRE
jgi:hypothetical protein